MTSTRRVCYFRKPRWSFLVVPKGFLVPPKRFLVPPKGFRFFCFVFVKAVTKGLVFANVRRSLIPSGLSKNHQFGVNKNLLRTFGLTKYRCFCFKRYIPRPSNRCFLEAFEDIKTTRKHLLEGAGIGFCGVAMDHHHRSQTVQGERRSIPWLLPFRRRPGGAVSVSFRVVVSPGVAFCLGEAAWATPRRAETPIFLFCCLSWFCELLVMFGHFGPY